MIGLPWREKKKLPPHSSHVPPPNQQDWRVCVLSGPVGLMRAAFVSHNHGQSGRMEGRRSAFSMAHVLLASAENSKRRKMTRRIMSGMASNLCFSFPSVAMASDYGSAKTRLGSESSSATGDSLGAGRPYDSYDVSRRS